MGEVIRCFRVNLVYPNMITHVIEPTGTFYHFHPDCYDRWSKRQLRSGAVSYTVAELEIDNDNLKGIDCHSCKQSMNRETIII